MKSPQPSSVGEGYVIGAEKPAKRGRGRPRKPRMRMSTEPLWLSPEDVSRLWEVPIERVLRSLELPAVCAIFFPGAVRSEDGTWRILGNALDGWLPLSHGIEPCLRLSTLSRLWDVPLHRLRVRAKSGSLPTVRVLGVHLRVRRSVALSEMRTGKPGRPPLSFFPTQPWGGK